MIFVSIILVLELKQKSFIQIMGTLYKQTPGHKYRLFRILGASVERLGATQSL